MLYNRIIISSVLFFAIVASCTKKEGNADNPYKNFKPKQTDDNPKDSTASATSILGLHRDIFQPTCANSGCHDGTFEPDFRTVESSFSSLVNVKPVKNDSAGTFNARVLPGNADASILIYRMTVNLGGNSGIMPLVIDPGNDYASKKDQLINNIKTWINNGAPDSRGIKPAAVDFPPQIMGVQALVGGNTLSRGGKYEPILSSAGPNVELWFSFADDKLTQDQLSNLTINWSTDPNNYDPGNEKPLVKAAAKLMPGLYAASIPYVWYYSFPTSGMKSLDVIWFRVTVSDGSNQNYQIPNANSMFFLKKYFAIKIP